MLLASRAACVRLRKFHATRHTFISLALTHGVNDRYLAERCGTSLELSERHYGRFMPGNEDAQLALLTEAAAPTEQPEHQVKPRPRRGKVAVGGETPKRMERPRRDLNPCCRRERPVSWARLDDGDVWCGRAAVSVRAMP